jgi:hypothetical protein
MTVVVERPAVQIASSATDDDAVDQPVGAHANPLEFNASPRRRR